MSHAYGRATYRLSVITAAQLRAARALLGIGKANLAERAGVSVPTIQRMEASVGDVRGIVDSLVKVVRALDDLGIELIGENAPSAGRGRGVRLKSIPAGDSAAAHKSVAPVRAVPASKPRPKVRV